MDMDDPWGSPWADELQVQNYEEVKGKDVRPTTPVRATTKALEAQTTSPWDDADDDGFGEWSSIPADDGFKMGLDGAVEDRERSMEETELEGDHSTVLPSWDHDNSLYSGPTLELAPSAEFHTGGLERERSPDPWASATTPDANCSERDMAAEHETESGSQVETPEQIKARKKSSNEEILPAASDEIVPVNGDDHDQNPASNDGMSEELEATPMGSKQDLTNSHDLVEPSPASAITENISSRPSSSPSERSHPDEAPSDSPRTSLDEEVKECGTTSSPPSKVQELVEHFDGMAKHEAKQSNLSRPELSENVQEKTETSPEQEEEDIDDDFGDFEEGDSEAESIAGDLVEDTKAKTLEVNKPQNVESSPPKRLSPKDIGPTEYAINTAFLDSIFADLEPQTKVESVFVPDTIPHDSFSSVEERKTWYRVSRYGPMRKHNTGDDENYIRVNWKKSQVRDETLKVVGRWMEEDRISGRVVLGGGSKGSTVFGWNDAKAAPVPLASAFAARKEKKIPIEAAPEVPREWPKGLVRKASTSKTRSPSKPRRRSSAKSPAVSEASKPPALTPLAMFGWNSSPDSTNAPVPTATAASGLSESQPKASMSPADMKTDSSQIPSLKPKAVAKAILDSKKSQHLQRSLSSADARPKSVVHKKSLSQGGHRRVESTPTANSSTITPKLSHVPTPISTASNDDDDDWGEMVSSPLTVTAPVFPMPNLNTQVPLAPLHAKPAISSPLHPSYPTTPTQSPRNNQSATFDKIPPLQASISQSSRLSDPAKINSLDRAPSQSPWTIQSANFQEMQTPAQAPILTTPNMIEGFGTPAAPPAQDTLQTKSSPMPANSIDPWASADFSFFEATPPAPKTVPAPSAAKSVSFQPPAVSSSRKDQRSREEIEQDKIVQSVVKGLPDLSYMLRK